VTKTDTLFEKVIRHNEHYAQILKNGKRLAILSFDAIYLSSQTKEAKGR
jgi:hypothetical protein